MNGNVAAIHHSASWYSPMLFRSSCSGRARQILTVATTALDAEMADRQVMAFEISGRLSQETGSVLSMENEAKILGLKSARSTASMSEAQRTRSRQVAAMLTCPKPSTLRGDGHDRSGQTDEQWRNGQVQDRQAEVWACRKV